MLCLESLFTKYLQSRRWQRHVTPTCIFCCLIRSSCCWTCRPYSGSAWLKLRTARCWMNSWAPHRCDAMFSTSSVRSAGLNTFTCNIHHKHLHIATYTTNTFIHQHLHIQHASQTLSHINTFTHQYLHIQHWSQTPSHINTFTNNMHHKHLHIATPSHININTFRYQHLPVKTPHTSNKDPPPHSLFLHFNGHFPGKPGLAGVYWSKGWWRWWWQLDYWSYKTYKAPVKSSPPTNQHPVFFTGRMPSLSPNQQCQSTEGKISHSMDLFTPSSPGGSSSFVSDH